jgi:predicted dehydrogenase
MITWDGEESFEATVAGNEPGLLRGQQVLPVPSAPNEDETHGHQSVLAEFIDAVKSGRKPETVSDDNIKSLSMVLGAIESARTGLPVSISVEGH